MLFLSFDEARIEAFKSQFYEAAKHYGEKNISFLIGDITHAQGALQVSFRNLHYFALWHFSSYIFQLITF